MCELFGFSAADSRELSAELQSFYSHSVNHPDGWGLGIFSYRHCNIEKEPTPAYKSTYLADRMTVPIIEKLVLGHIRKASVGSVKYKNCHPFTGRDVFGTQWVLTHNGTVFEEPDREVYKERQIGSTDSERILLRFLEQVNTAAAKPSPEECAGMLEKLMDKLAISKNKINMMLSDGENLFVYASHAEKLQYRKQPGEVTLSTLPLSEEGWEKVPECCVVIYRDGEQIYAGEPHGASYIPPQTT